MSLKCEEVCYMFFYTEPALKQAYLSFLVEGCHPPVCVTSLDRVLRTEAAEMTNPSKKQSQLEAEPITVPVMHHVYV